MYSMLRKERQMSEEHTQKFLLEAKVGRLGLSHNDEPYVVPVLYVYDPEIDVIYIHCAKKGRKIDVICANRKVCFEIDEFSGIVIADKPCEYDLIYRSVIIFGEASFIYDSLRKADVLKKIMEKYTKTMNDMPVTAKMAEGIQIIVIKILNKGGKENKGRIIPYP